MLLACLFVGLCVAAYVFRKTIFNYIGGLLYAFIRKSIESCAGKVMVTTAHPVDLNTKAEDIDNADEAIAYPRVSRPGWPDYVIDARMVGQNFALNAKRNVRYCTPDESQDLCPTNNLA